MKSSRSTESKKSHYELVKHYFKKNIVNRNGYQAEYKNAIKKDRRRSKIQDICFSILDQIMQSESGVKKLIDVGCGVGDFTLDLAVKYSQFEKVVGIDFLKERVDIARQKVEQIKNVFFFEADLLDIPFVDRSFDMTICINVLHHVYIDDFSKAIRELARITGKYLILEIRNKKNIFNFWYKYVVIPLFYRDLPVYDISISEVCDLIKNDYQLEMTRGVLSVDWGCRRLILVFKRINNDLKEINADDASRI